ncbi:DUF6894 family protein [Mesorhizobium sp. BR1-1-7]|uniref:DUF6894 family protein n=1 Tax=Mesorhizobium sp. BR1-1-7 TaxID=2876647 RepID=UPI00398D2A3F
MLLIGLASLVQVISTRPTCTKGTPQLSGHGSSRMARFFFDSGEHDVVIKDQIGIECAGLEEVRRVGFEGLIDLTRDALTEVDGSRCLLKCGTKTATGF